ncbi:SDR family NAD(P)-dependent oxidoreductase [Sphingomonas immobilis]|uniref:SDR family NAD(P)-dependent oxidoreductase n=1 Tax=Sphingomonas immobilis TaxID=3063997 RepID=A0ABT9A004_9SPHN|nr:SDR family NAD(P)-dependent oxidoreductase [Sphingomonas sp. CA1-15]MDO7843164.1 SDR family NAD(P)-dependent oxidoreductase [Sphingomonas sp. CA1-15]
MELQGNVTVVTGGAGGLGLATAERIVAGGGKVVLVDLPSSNGEQVAADLGDNARFAAADITDSGQFDAALDIAQQLGELRGMVHCAGRGATLRVLDRDGAPGSLETYEAIVRLNLIGSFNVLRLAAARMARNEPVDGERGAIVLTASVAAYEGQIGQIPYASSKAGIVGMTLVAARDLAARGIRVNSIAPGVFDTPILDRLGDEIKASLGAKIPFPPRLGRPAEFGKLAAHMLENGMINGETVRIDGAMRMPPK